MVARNLSFLFGSLSLHFFLAITGAAQELI